MFQTYAILRCEYSNHAEVDSEDKFTIHSKIAQLGIKGAITRKIHIGLGLFKLEAALVLVPVNLIQQGFTL